MYGKFKFWNCTDLRSSLCLTTIMFSTWMQPNFPYRPKFCKCLQCFSYNPTWRNHEIQNNWGLNIPGHLDFSKTIQPNVEIVHRKHSKHNFIIKQYFPCPICLYKIPVFPQHKMESLKNLPKFNQTSVFHCITSNMSHFLCNETPRPDHPISNCHNLILPLS